MGFPEFDNDGMSQDGPTGGDDGQDYVKEFALPQGSTYTGYRRRGRKEGKGV